MSAPAPADGAVVVGGGTMGAGVAAAFLAHGWRVCVVEPDGGVRAGLGARLASLIGAAPRGLAIAAGLEDVDWTGVRIVSENATEDLGIKRRVFAALHDAAPAGIALTSNSSTLPIQATVQGLARTGAMLGAHFLMPAHVVPIVEVLDTGTAEPAVVDDVMAILASIGKMPVRLTREVPGFLVNRMQAALMREALSLVDQGIASARDVDLAVRYGFGFRYAACGPIVQKEHSGWDVSTKLYRSVFPTLCNDAQPAAVLEHLIAAGEFGMKSGAGFVRWNEADMARERERFNRAMARALEVLREDDGAPPLAWRNETGE